jgi:hypothetical protein
MLDGDVRAAVYKEVGVALVDVKPHLSRKKDSICGSACVVCALPAKVCIIFSFMVEFEGGTRSYIAIS